MILYLETNFLMGVATGRDAEWASLLDTAEEAVRLVLPSICIMEALSAFEDEQKRRNRFGSQIDEHLTQLRRDLTSAHASALLQALEQARVHNQNLTNDITQRLFQAIDRLTGRAEMLPLNPATCRTAMRSVLLRDPTDSLILAVVLEHARLWPDQEKCLLTANTRDFAVNPARAALAAAGIKFFASTANVLGWISSRKTS